MALSDIGNRFTCSFKILVLIRYCKTIYPSKDVRNVVEANNRVLVDNSLVTPYRCLGELFTHYTGKCFNQISGLVSVLENLKSPGILFWHFPGLESPGKRPLVLESSGNLLNSTKKYEVYGR